jgi:hypothetical protein
MKIEEVLAAYLPYRLKMRFANGKDYELQGIGECRPMGLVNMYTTEGGSTYVKQIKNSKPILKPLSNFCGKRIAKDVMNDLNCSYTVVYDIWKFEDGSIKLKDIRFETYNVMCKNHIDFDGLIKKGLAIDINTLKN